MQGLGIGRAARRFMADYVLCEPEERQQAGELCGLLLAIGSLVVLLFPLLPGGNTVHLGVRIPLAVAGLAWGLFARFVLDWRRAPIWTASVTFVVGLIGSGIQIWATGTGATICPLFLVWMSLVGAYFFRPMPAGLYLLAVLAVQAAPLAYQTNAALHHRVVVELIVAAAGDASVAMSIVSAKNRLVRLRRRAETEALTDSLTGAANHRVLDEGLRAAIARSTRRGDTLAVAVIDIDHFKQVNDLNGHDYGDTALVRVTHNLLRAAGTDDIVARSGGDEFTWVMPHTHAGGAFRRVEAARRRIEAQTDGAITISAGITDTSQTVDPGHLVRLADGALYWSKAHGRNSSQVYDPAIVDVFSAEERADRLARSQALLGLRALARAIDAKDPATRAHSERVAEMARRLAVAAGWNDLRADLLGEAALVHDVGKIAIEDAILHKRGALTPAERERVQAHAELSAQIVDGVLSPEQVEWIRTHHERADGAGYPRGLTEADIPPGGALLAVADAFDVMTAGRAYSHRRMASAALEEVRTESGRQFSAAAVAALERMLAVATAPEGEPALAT
jgi:diguanylate cyclase (GGDEF)-like protein